METVLKSIQLENKIERQVTVIPATCEECNTSNADAIKKIRVAAYARVSTDYEEQQS